MNNIQIIIDWIDQLKFELGYIATRISSSEAQLAYGLYMCYDDVQIGPMAPDNPRHSFIGPEVDNKCRQWIAIMKQDFNIEYSLVQKQISDESNKDE